MKCFLYARKSTEDKTRQIQSIGDQIRVLTQLSKDRECTIVDTIEDEKSAKDVGRKGFASMMERIKNEEACGILCWNMDRLSRNPKDSGELMWLLQKGIIKAIFTPERTYYPEDSSILLSVETGRSTDFIRKLSTDVKRGMGSKIEKGWMPSKAPLGYRNEVEAIKGQKRILPDPDMFPLVRSLWRKLLDDGCSTMQLFRHMENECPIYRNEKLIAFSTFHKIFQNPFYCGLYRWNGELHVGKHQSMISQTEFEKVQTYLKNGKGIRERSVEFPFKGLLHCGTCDAFLTAERKTKFVKSIGKTKDYDFYRCVHRKRSVVPCREKPLSANKLEKQLLKEIEDIQITDAVIEFGINSLDAMDKVRQETTKEKQLRNHIISLKKKVSLVEENISEERDSDTRSIMKRRFNQLCVEQRKAEEDLRDAENERSNQNSDIRDRLSLIHGAKEVISHGSAQQKKDVLNGIGSNWKLSQQKLHYDPHYVSLALKEVKKTHAKELAMIEPEKSQSVTGKSLHSELVSVVWSGIRESNPRCKLGKLVYYHCTNPA